MLRINTLYIYTDGSCLPSPRRGGIGIRYKWLDEQEIEQEHDHVTVGYKAATNNQMELRACIEGGRGPFALA